MKKFCIIVDTSSNIKPNEFEDVFVVPMLLTKSEKNIVKTFHDQTDIDTNEMLKEMVDGEVYKTASPVMGECLSILEKAVKQYENVFIFSMPKILSGTFNQWKLLASEFGNVKVFEFAFAGDNYKQIIKDIFLMKEETISKIEEYINQINKKNVFSAVIGETKYLVRGGRISFLKGFLASLFQFKIILQVNCENGLTFYSKTRKWKNAVEKIQKLFFDSVKANNNNVEYVCFFTSQIDKKSNFEFLFASFKKIYSNAKFAFSQLPSVLAAHSGPNYFAISVKLK